MDLFGDTGAINFSYYSKFPVNSGKGGWDRGARARKNWGREGYRRRERKGREAGVLRGREAGEKCKTLIIVIYYTHFEITGGPCNLIDSN